MRFRVNGNEIVFDDGGMNLLSSLALRELRALVEDRQSRLSESSSSSGQAGSPVLRFRSGRAHIFAAGADMAEMQQFGAHEAEAFARLGQELFETIERLPCVTVALIDGDCYGGALDLALSFDFRFATPRSRFAHPGARLGIVTGFGGTSRWRKVMSRRAANQLFLANRVLTAEDALALGLVDRVADSHEDELRRLETLDRGTTRLVKTLANHGSALSRSELVRAARLTDGLRSR